MLSSSLEKIYSLFIDTHDDYLRIVLYRNEEIINKIIKQSEQSHSTLTMKSVEKILKEENITVQNLKEIFVVNGPGSFTGVRIAVTIAKTLAFTLNIPIKTITSLQVKALSSTFKGEKLVVESDKNGSYICEFNAENKKVGEYRYLKNKEFAEYISDKGITIIEDEEIDWSAIYSYLKEMPATKVHQVKPLYIKNIDL